MKNYKIVLIGIVVSVFITANLAQAQKYPVAISAEKGVMVYVGNTLGKDIHYLLEKKDSTQQKYATLAILTRPSSYLEFKSLLLYYSTLVASININDDKLVMSAWNELNKESSGKTTVFGNIPAVTLASGLAFYDTAVAENKSYTYKVTILKNGKPETSSISEPIKHKTQLITNSILPHYQATDEKHIFLEWYIVEMPRPANFEVYRSIVAKTEFSPVSCIRGFRSSGDTLILTVKDTLVRPNENYVYYLQAKDLFGNPFQVSEHVRVNTSSSASNPIVLKFKATSNELKRAIELNFRISASPELRCISIERSDEFDGKYSLLSNIPPTDTTFFDKSAIPFKNYYYRIVIQTLNGKTFPSANVAGFLSIQQFLLPPKNLKASLTANGVELNWENTEPNIVGFIVYRCEGYKGTLEQISPIINSKDLFKAKFSDTLVRPKTIYSYSVKSIDKLLTESAFTDTVSITPIKQATPPAIPTRLRANASSTDITITWDNMYANEPYLIGYNIYRKKVGENDKSLTKLNTEMLPNLHNYFVDSAITLNAGYVYTVEAVDMYNLVSDHSFPIESKVITPKPVSPTGVRLFNQTDEILITWDEPMSTNVSEYRLYRIVGEGKPKQIGTFKTGTTSAHDKEVKADSYYVYYLTSVSTYGVESDVINVVSIRR